VDLTHQLSEGVVLNHGHAASPVESSCHVLITTVNLHVMLVRKNWVDEVVNSMIGCGLYVPEVDEVDLK